MGRRFHDSRAISGMVLSGHVAVKIRTLQAQMRGQGVFEASEILAG
jgi:hypothetical protein